MFFLVGCGETNDSESITESPEINEYLSKVEALVIEVEQFVAINEYDGSDFELNSKILNYTKQGAFVNNCGPELAELQWTPTQNQKHLELSGRFMNALAKSSSIKAKE